MSLPWLKNVSEIEANYFSEVHGSITPAEVRAGEPIRAILSSAINGSVLSKEVVVWRLSPLGIEVVLPHEFQDSYTGQTFDIDLSVGRTTSKLHGVIATTKHQEMDRIILGLRLCVKEELSWGGDERRQTQRWLTSRDKNHFFTSSY